MIQIRTSVQAKGSIIKNAAALEPLQDGNQYWYTIHTPLEDKLEKAVTFQVFVTIPRQLDSLESFTIEGANLDLAIGDISHTFIRCLNVNIGRGDTNIDVSCSVSFCYSLCVYVLYIAFVLTNNGIFGYGLCRDSTESWRRSTTRLRAGSRVNTASHDLLPMHGQEKSTRTSTSSTPTTNSPPRALSAPHQTPDSISKLTDPISLDLLQSKPRRNVHHSKSNSILANRLPPLWPLQRRSHQSSNNACWATLSISEARPASGCRGHTKGGWRHGRIMERSLWRTPSFQ